MRSRKKACADVMFGFAKSAAYSRPTMPTAKNQVSVSPSHVSMLMTRSVFFHRVTINSSPVAWIFHRVYVPEPRVSMAAPSATFMPMDPSCAASAGVTRPDCRSASGDPAAPAGYDNTGESTWISVSSR